MITYICCHVSGHLMDFSVILTLLLALFWSSPTPEGNIWPVLRFNLACQMFPVKIKK